jgi:hypothetical protein
MTARCRNYIYHLTDQSRFFLESRTALISEVTWQGIKKGGLTQAKVVVRSANVIIIRPIAAILSESFEIKFPFVRNGIEADTGIDGIMIAAETRGDICACYECSLTLVTLVQTNVDSSRRSCESENKVEELHIVVMIGSSCEESWKE